MGKDHRGTKRRKKATPQGEKRSQTNPDHGLPLPWLIVQSQPWAPALFQGAAEAGMATQKELQVILTSRESNPT